MRARAATRRRRCPIDPDEALRTALSSPDEAERSEAVNALRGWLARGGFPPREAIVREAGVDRRMPLPCGHGGVYLEKYRDGWAVVIPGPRRLDPVTVYYKLRKD